VLPDWPEGTVTVLVTAGLRPHAIPVSAALRAGPRRALLGLGARRGSLARLREFPGAALVILCQDTAITAHGQARVIDEELTEGVVAVALEVEDVQDHDRPTFEMLGGVRWRWADEEALARDAEVRAGLRRLAERPPG
jgi:hypothetical protein